MPAAYRTKGVASSANTPGGETYASCTADNSGVVYLFGGNQGGGSNNDLWTIKFPGLAADTTIATTASTGMNVIANGALAMAALVFLLVNF